MISGTVQYGAAEDFDGSYDPTIIVANNQGGSTQTTFNWTINQAQVAPTLTDPGDQSNLHGDNVSLQLSASQVDNDPLFYDASNLPAGLSIDADIGLISGTIDPSAATGTPYAVTVTVTDESTNLSASQTFNWTISAANTAPVLTDPGDQNNAAGDEVSLQLAATDADGNTLTYTATGLPPGLTLDPVAGTITGTLPNSAASSTPYSVTVTASNGTYSSSQSFNWTVNPISLSNPGDQSNLDGDSVSLQLTATDAANGTLSYSATGLPPGLNIDSGTGLISGTIDNTADTNSPYSVTVTASDDAGNNASQSFTWTVAALALNPVGDQENQEGTDVALQVSATDNVGTPTYSATGLPDGLSIDAATGLISGTIDVAAHGSSPYQVTVTATDGANTSSQSFVWTVAPRVNLTNPGPQSNATGDSVSLQVSATSPGGTMSYSATGLPDGLSIDSGTGIISGTLAGDAASSTPYTVTVTANDGTSSSSQTFQWTVSVINLVSPGDQSNLDGDAVSLPLTTGYNGSGTLSYSATGLPPGLSIDSGTGEITGTLDNSADTDSPYAATVTVTDGTDTSNQTFNWTVSPLVSVDPIDDQNNADGDNVSLQISASDALNNTLSYDATGLPPGLTIDSATGLISGTIDTGADSSSPYAVTVTVSDGTVTATQTFTWNVAAVGLVNPGPQASADGQAVSLQMQGSAGATYMASGLPNGLTIDGNTGLISGTLASDADMSSPYSVMVTATLGGNSVNQTFVWTVTPIGLVAPTDQTNTEGDSVSLQLQGLSNGGSLTYSASGLPDGLSLDPATGLITGTIAAGAAANGPFTVDVSVTDGTISASQSFTWTVNPVVSLTTPDDQSNNEGDNVSLPISATDSLSNPLTYSADGLPNGLSIDSGTGLISGTVSAGDAATGPYAVTVTATDSTYSSSVTFTWNVTHTDTTTPTMTNPGTQTNVAGDSVSLPINASDPDGDALTFSATGLPDGLEIDSTSGAISGTLTSEAISPTPYVVTVTTQDGNGQSVSQTFNWIVNDAAIQLQALPINVTEGADTGDVLIASFTDPNPGRADSDYVATIDWGDGNSDAGIVDGSSDNFNVYGSHTYAHPGNYTVQVTLSDSNGETVSASGTASVMAAAITANGGLVGYAVKGEDTAQTVATFTDANPNEAENSYTADIDWGDGNQSIGTVKGSNGQFSVAGSHAYASNGTYTVTVTVTDMDGTQAMAASTVEVGDVYAGIPSNLMVASFTDSDPSVSESHFTATIDWGDGTQGIGTVTGGNGTFVVQGTHPYAQDSSGQPGGVYTVTVTVSDPSGDTLTASGSVVVVRSPIAVYASNVVESTSGIVNNALVAEFTDPNANDSAGEYSAMIDWGDGVTSAATSIVKNGNVFEVYGSHTYAQAQVEPVAVTISWGDPQSQGRAQAKAAPQPIEKDVSLLPRFQRPSSEDAIE